MNNPFLTVGYAGEEYFCDRVSETAKLTKLLTNGNNVALISPRRMGKTGLIRHCFAQKKIARAYNTFVIDIYATKCLNDLVYEMGRQIVNELKPHGKKAIEKFVEVVKSLRAGISFDVQGMPSWNVELGDIKTPQLTLDEIFAYIEQADKPSLVAIDEFQSISYYPEKNTEATLRTYIQRTNNANFVFSGSQRTMMNEMFVSAARPFYQSVTIMNLGTIAEDKYDEFIQHHFEANNRHIEGAAIHETYQMFDGVTWYIQKTMNALFAQTDNGETCSADQVAKVVDEIMSENADAYGNILFQLTPPQKALLFAIGKERCAKQITGQKFIKKYSLPSASSIQKAALALQEKQLVTSEQGVYEVYDKFMSLWMAKSF